MTEEEILANLDKATNLVTQLQSELGRKESLLLAGRDVNGDGVFDQRDAEDVQLVQRRVDAAFTKMEGLREKLGRSEGQPGSSPGASPPDETDQQSFPKGSVALSFVDGFADPLNGVEVKILESGKSARSDGKGEVSFADIDAGAEYSFRLRHPGDGYNVGIERVERIFVEPNKKVVENFSFPMTPVADLEVTVTGLDGRPAAIVTLTIEPTGQIQSTGANGLAYFPRVEAGVPLTLKFDYLSADQNNEMRAKTHRESLKIQPSISNVKTFALEIAYPPDHMTEQAEATKGAAEFQILDGAGNAIENGSVTVPEFGAAAQSNSAGFARLDDLPAGRDLLFVVEASTGFIEQKSEIVVLRVPEHDTAREEVRLPVVHAESLDLSFYGSKGKPLAGVQVDVFHSEGKQSLQTDGNGRATVENLPGGTKGHLFYRYLYDIKDTDGKSSEKVGAKKFEIQSYVSNSIEITVEIPHVDLVVNPDADGFWQDLISSFETKTNNWLIVFQAVLGSIHNDLNIEKEDSAKEMKFWGFLGDALGAVKMSPLAQAASLAVKLGSKASALASPSKFKPFGTAVDEFIGVAESAMSIRGPFQTSIRDFSKAPAASEVEYRREKQAEVMRWLADLPNAAKLKAEVKKKMKSSS